MTNCSKCRSRGCSKCAPTRFSRKALCIRARGHEENAASSFGFWLVDVQGMKQSTASDYRRFFYLLLKARGCTSSGSDSLQRGLKKALRHIDSFLKTPRYRSVCSASASVKPAASNGRSCTRLLTSAKSRCSMNLKGMPGRESKLAIPRSKKRDISFAGTHEKEIWMDRAPIQCSLEEELVSTSPESSRGRLHSNFATSDVLSLPSPARGSSVLPFACIDSRALENAKRPQCFLPGTLLKTAGGNWVDAFDVQQPSRIQSAESQRLLLVARVTIHDPVRRQLATLTSNGCRLCTITADHRISVVSDRLTNLQAGNLLPGDTVVVEGVLTRLDEIRLHEEVRPVAEIHFSPDEAVCMSMRTPSMFVKGAREA